MKRLGQTLLTIVITCAVILGCGSMMRSKIVDFFKTTEVSETTIETIKEKLKETAELNTAEYVCTDMLTKSDVKEFHNWTIPFTENEFAISYDGTIKAGIKDLTQADVEQSGSKIIITLPEVEITGIELGNYKKYDEKNNIADCKMKLDI